MIYLYLKYRQDEEELYILHYAIDYASMLLTVLVWCYFRYYFSCFKHLIDSNIRILMLHHPAFSVVLKHFWQKLIYIIPSYITIIMLYTRYHYMNKWTYSLGLGSSQPIRNMSSYTCSWPILMKSRQ